MSFELLVVEDDLASAELLREVLEAEGAKVTVATRSVLGAQLITERPFDGIFLDLHMPGIDGWEMTALIRASRWNRHAPVVIVSGSPRDAMNRAFAAGATLFLAKPVNKRKLIQAYRSVQNAILAHRRRFVRLPFTAQILCRSSAFEVRFCSDNLSVRGMLLRSEHRLKVGDSASLSFSLDSGERVVVSRARVVRVDASGRAAFTFESVPATDDRLLKDFVAAATA